MIPRNKPHIISFPLVSTSATEIDQNFTVLFQDIQRLGQLATQQLYRSVVGSTTLLLTDYLVNVEMPGSIIIGLPSAIGNTGKTYVVKNSSTGVVTIDPMGSQTIDGGLSAVIATQYTSWTFMSNGANWIII